MAQKITKREQDYSQWYLDVVKEAKLAEHSPVRGCMVIRPTGMSLWENMRDALDNMFKETGHENAYFPLFIPKSFLSKEAQHVEGFAKECAVITHSRLKSVDGGVEVDPDSKLEEELIVRPTSETIIWDTYRNWIQSYRDLPILINQWANVVRWEMRTRLFLRTMEFLWQEGHTAHATEQEAIDETLQMLEVYRTFAEEFMAMPVITGLKTESERFAGAVDTYCIEALMQDGKALQAGTSHFLGQNFAKAFDVKFQDKENNQKYVWATSWGVSTRLIGGLIMTHSDDNGLVIPPKLAPTQVVIVPIYKSNNPEQKRKVLIEAKHLKKRLSKRRWSNRNISVMIDDREHVSNGFKFSEHEAQGVPIRITLGERDIDQNKLEIVRRDKPRGENKFFEKYFSKSTKNEFSLYYKEKDGFESRIKWFLNDMQKNLFETAKKRREEATSEVSSYEEFKTVLDEKGGFIYAHWDGTSETEELIKKETKATIRCIPLHGDKTEGICMVTGKPSVQKVLFAKSY